MKVFLWIKLMRPKHYLKNLLIFAPVFFDNKFFEAPLITRCICGCIIFSLLSSVIYIINDLNDIQSDRLHEKKKNRPLASGDVSIKEAALLLCFLTVCIVVLYVMMPGEGKRGWQFLVAYFGLNVAYSVRFKQIPLLDIVILVSGFLLRLLYGAAIVDIQVSFWLCMTVMAASFYLGMGKRRNELKRNSRDAEKIRGVLKFYSIDFLDKNMYMCMGMAVVFYALWSGAVETVGKTGINCQIWTVPLVMVIAMKYSLDIESGEYADPVEVITGDKWILFLVCIYILVMLYILYIS